MENYKLAFIYGKDDENRNIKEGNIERLGDAHDEEQLHINCLLEYAKHRYSDIGIFKKLNSNHMPETAGYFFTLFGHIVFFNTTKNVEKYGKSGIFLMPQELTDIQKIIL